jgi:hypothetical protein
MRPIVLFSLSLDGTMMSVPVTIGKTFEPVVPVPLFTTKVTGLFPYDVAADGRFIVNTASDAASAQQPVTGVLNWESRLKK